MVGLEDTIKEDIHNVVASCIQGAKSQITNCIREANSSIVVLTVGDSVFSLLEDSEIKKLTEVAVNHTRAIEKRHTVIVAAANPGSTSRTVAFAKFARDAGADVLMVRLPLGTGR